MCQYQEEVRRRARLPGNSGFAACEFALCPFNILRLLGVYGEQGGCLDEMTSPEDSSHPKQDEKDEKPTQ